MAESSTIGVQDQIAAGTPVGAESLVQVALWLAVVIAAILLCAWLLRRFGGMTTGGSGVIRVLTAISLGSRDRIALIQAGDKQILLGISPGRINTLHVFDEPVLPDAAANTPSGQTEFARKLQELLGKGAR